MKKYSFLLLALICISSISFSQTVTEPTRVDSNWKKNYEPFRIAGNLYYVGTYDLSSYLITTEKGNILINTGLASSAAQIKQNIETLGFKFSDIKILLTTQAHYDHMGAMAAIKDQTHAKFYVDAGDKEVAETGGAADYEMGKYGMTFQPLKVDKVLKDGAIIKLGKTKLQLLHHPGHTKGSCSFLFETSDSSRSYKVLIANMPSIIIDKRFDEVTSYPGISADYANTLKAMKKLDFDVWVASHASQFNLHEKRQTGDAYDPFPFTDKQLYIENLNELQKAYDDKIKRDVGTGEEKK